MRRSLVILLFLAASALVSAIDGAMPSSPWFDHVKAPTKLSHQQLGELALSLHSALKDGKSLKEIAALFPVEGTPRGVFITIGDEEWPGRTYFGTGLSFRAALQTAVQILLDNEPSYAKETEKLCKSTIADLRKEKKTVPQAWQRRLENPGKWTWLKLDVVQASKPVMGFMSGRSRLAMTSLVGFTFGPEAGFSYTPDQITGRCLISDSGHLAKQQITNIIAETYNWSAMKSWMQLSSLDAPYRICLFETDSYYTDGKTACRLYRGHRLEDAAPSAVRCIELARACADTVCANISRNGQFPAMNPGWFPSAKEDENFEERAAFAIAIARLGNIVNGKKYSEAAASVLHPVLVAMPKAGKDGKHIAILEDEKLPEGSMRQPEKVALLRTNALACIALCELRHLMGDDFPGELQERIAVFGRFLLANALDGGDFNLGRRAKDGSVITDDDRTPYVKSEDASLACIALSMAEPDNPKAMAAVKATLLSLLEHQVKRPPLEMVSISPWLAEALVLLVKEDKSLADNKDFVHDIVNASVSTVAQVNLQPLYPDYYGVSRRNSGCTYAADRSLLLANLSSLLRGMGKVTLASEQVMNALPVLIFQCQAFIDEPASSVLPSPAVYRGLFRDNLENYGFNLSGQSTQIMSLLAMAAEMARMPLLERGKVQRQLAEVRRQTDVHPNPLTVDLVMTNAADKDGDMRDVAGELSRSANVKLKGKGGKIQKTSGAMESRVLK